ncbi:hypothetical protein AAXE64_27790 [Priestia megaterium]|uniref:hypothetical protein n=1 Tax=Priestia megaterium TaxID=1404 RepID=UPI003D0241ED
MFVISIILDGTLDKTAIRGNADDAVNTAQDWYQEYKERSGILDYEKSYIAIDQRIPNKKENERFAELRFNDRDDELRLFAHGNPNSPIFKDRFANVTKHFFVSFLEFSLFRLSEYLKNRPKP